MQAEHIWFVASHRKASVLLQQLKSSGHPADQVDRIVAPAGVPIGAKTPEEIALSVLATVVAGRRQSAPTAANHANASTRIAAAGATTASVAAQSCCAVGAGDIAQEAAQEVAAGATAVGQSASGWRGKLDYIAERFSNTPPSCCGGGH